MKVIIDLDYTLLDTVAFKDAIIAALERYGIDADVFDRTYVETCNVATYYDPEAHSLLLAGAAARPSSEILREMEIVASQAAHFLYPGAHEFLCAVRDAGCTMALLTFGDERWQRRKCDGCGLDALFDEVVPTARRKCEIVSALAGGGPVLVVNDNASEVAEMMVALPTARFVVKRGPKSANAPAAALIAENFDEILGFLKQFQNDTANAV